MIGNVDDKLWTAVATGATIAAAMATRSALKAAWRRTTDQDPPRNPGDSDTDWTEAIIWTAATSLAVGMARLLALRGATAAWSSVAGHSPPDA